MNKNKKNYDFLKNKNLWESAEPKSVKAKMRLEVLKEFAGSLSMYTVARDNGIAASTLLRWLHAFEAEGVEGINKLDRWGVGKKYEPRCSLRAKLPEVKKEILRRQKELGFMNVREAANTLNEKFNVYISHQTASELMRSAGLSYFHGRWIEKKS